MNAAYIIVSFVIVAAIIGAIFVLQTPDFDEIIESGNCNAMMTLTDAQLSGATTDQKTKLAILLADCIIGG